MKQEIIKQFEQEIGNVEAKLAAMKSIYDNAVAPGNVVAYLCYAHMLTATIQTYKVASNVVKAAQWTAPDISGWEIRRDDLLEQMRLLEVNNPLGPVTVPSYQLG